MIRIQMGDFDIYLLDIEMPEESGMELAKYIREFHMRKLRRDL